jgi:hypothetical protein
MEWIALLHILEVMGSNIGIEVGLPDPDFLWFSSDSELTPERS